MRLRNLDVFRVLNIGRVQAVVENGRTIVPDRKRLSAASRVVEMIAAEADADGIIDATLRGIWTCLGFGYGLFLQFYEERNQLITIGSLGYEPSGIGSDVPFGEGVIGAAAASGKIVKVSDMSRVRRFGVAVQHSSLDENRTRSILLPGMPDAMSQIAVPFTVSGVVRGVLFLESRGRIGLQMEGRLRLSKETG